MNASIQRNWWHEPAVVTIALAFCFPVGLALLWTAPYPAGWKWGVTALIVAVVVLGIVATMFPSVHTSQ